MKSVLVCGANGQLGRELSSLAVETQVFNFHFTDIDELDISNPSEVMKFFSEIKPDFVINCAAYTDVEKAEDEPSKAELINAVAVKNLAEASKANNSFFIHISTDYVFAGNACSPYREVDKTNPQSVYGETKLKGEIAFLESGVNGIIIRTSWLYSIYGKNFVKTIINLAKSRPEIRVVYDQVGSPTNAHDLAVAIYEIINLGDLNKHENKIYHFSNEGVCSWYDFAKEIIKFTYVDCKVLPVRTDEFPTKAKRPSFSVMDKSLIKNNFNLNIPHWKESLHSCLEKLK